MLGVLIFGNSQVRSIPSGSLDVGAVQKLPKDENGRVVQGLTDERLAVSE